MTTCSAKCINTALFRLSSSPSRWLWNKAEQTIIYCLLSLQVWYSVKPVMHGQVFQIEFKWAAGLKTFCRILENILNCIAIQKHANPLPLFNPLHTEILQRKLVPGNVNESCNRNSQYHDGLSQFLPVFNRKIVFCSRWWRETFMLEWVEVCLMLV